MDDIEVQTIFGKLGSIVGKDKTPLKTKLVKSVVENKEALSLYVLLRDSIQWEDGIRSRSGFTRKAKPLQNGDFPLIDDLIEKCLKEVSTPGKAYVISHIYLNYYENGNMFTPNHSHPGTHQMVISLGETRTLEVCKKSYILENGDVIIFGASMHGVPKSNAKNGRISIATFMIPVLTTKNI